MFHKDFRWPLHYLCSSRGVIVSNTKNLATTVWTLSTFQAPAKINAVVAIIFGVSGAGKTTIGKLLAEELEWKFYEADDFHSQSNIDKMRRGVPLTDRDRQPWLMKLRELIERCLAANENAVLACSALKEKYRRRLQVNDQVKFVYLRGDYELVANQLRARRGHFMNPELLKSQFADLEEPAGWENAIVIELGRSPLKLVTEIKKKLETRQEAEGKP
jgi:gluconokinase